MTQRMGEMTMWKLVRTDVKQLPDTAHDMDELETKLAKFGYRVDAMTDQVDVYRGQRRIATYVIS